MDSEKKSLSQDLAQAFNQLHNEQELFRFLRDLLTRQELIELTKRWEAAQMLAAKTPYTTISQEIGISSATIAQVSHWYKKGLGGYKLAIKRLWSSQKFG